LGLGLAFKHDRKLQVTACTDEAAVGTVDETGVFLGLRFPEQDSD